jgi:hypothetical protein
VEKVRNYYCESIGVIEEIKRKREECVTKLKDIDEAARDIPSLL